MFALYRCQVLSLIVVICMTVGVGLFYLSRDYPLGMYYVVICIFHMIYTISQLFLFSLIQYYKLVFHIHQHQV